MDPLKPLFVRLHASTLDAVKKAQQKSSHRSIASFVDDILRRHLSVAPRPVDRVDQLTKASSQLKDIAT